MPKYEYGNTESNMAAELMWFRTCQDGTWMNSVNYPGMEQLRKPCRLLHHQNPYLKLGPFKEEMYSVVPYSVVFHDILTDAEVDFMKAESTPKLSRARIPKTRASNIAEIKSGKRSRQITKTVQAWLQEVDWPITTGFGDYRYVGPGQYLKLNYPILWKMNRKITLATQLILDTQTSSTPIQVTNYGLGGLCEPHGDQAGVAMMSEKDIKEVKPQLLYTGDTIATFMAWLADTEAGGGTAYVYPGHERVISPEKGAAAFWYDLKSDLTADATTFHAGCPVIKGNKWILNKWIYSYDNFKKFPCKLVQDERFSPPSMKHYHND